MEKSKYNITLKFTRNNLLYDINNYAFIEGDAIGKEREHSRHLLIDITQKGNVDRVTRVLNLAHSMLVELLRPFTSDALTDDAILVDDLKEEGLYVITLELPDGFSKTTINHLENLIHEYLVCSVLADWMSFVYPEKQAIWNARLLGIAEDITKAKSRGGLFRRKTSPF